MKGLSPRIKQVSLWTGILLSVLLTGLPATAQRIRFCDTSNKWSHPFCDWSAGMQAPPGAYYWYSSSSAYIGDTAISGTVYHRLRTSDAAGNFPIAAVREDTTLQKVFFRLLSGSDTVEHILYDYNLGLSDTLKIDVGAKHFRYVVRAVDSVQMDGAYYKRWEVYGLSPLLVVYYLIEGIGSSRTPLSVLFPNSFENANQLRCFSNNGLHPRCTPATPLFKTYSMVPFFAHQPIPVDSFDNDSSCIIQYLPPVQVPTMAPGSAPLVAPNPGGREAMLIMPSSAGGYTLTIHDVTGRTVATVTQSRAQQQPIGKLIQTEGLYFYSIQVENGQRLSGKFLFR